jgi:hypothetical protein vspiD_23825
MKTTIWFTSGYSNLYNIFNDLKNDNSNINILCSHEKNNFVGFKAADEYVVEQAYFNKNFVDYVIKKYQPKIIISSWEKQQRLFINNHYENIVQATVVKNQQELDVVNNKALFYGRLLSGNLKVNIPQFAVFNNAENLKHIRHSYFDYLSDKQLCVKPEVGVYANGFMRFDDEKNDFNNIMSTNRKISFNRFVELYQQNEFDSNYLLMEYLSGNEYSADCAAGNGELFAIGIREKIPTLSSDVNKTQSYQRLAFNKEIFNQVKEITKHFKLHGLFNIQFKDNDDAIPFLLEMNPRLSGNASFANVVGMNLSLMFCNVAIDFLNNSNPQLHLNKYVEQLEKIEQLGYRMNNEHFNVVNASQIICL